MCKKLRNQRKKKVQSSSSAEQRESAAMEDLASQLHEALRLWSLSVGEIIPRDGSEMENLTAKVDYILEQWRSSVEFVPRKKDDSSSIIQSKCGSSTSSSSASARDKLKKAVYDDVKEGSGTKGTEKSAGDGSSRSKNGPSTSSSESVLVKTETDNDVVRDEGAKGSEKALGKRPISPDLEKTETDNVLIRDEETKGSEKALGKRPISSDLRPPKDYLNDYLAQLSSHFGISEEHIGEFFNDFGTPVKYTESSDICGSPDSVNKFKFVDEGPTTPEIDADNLADLLYLLIYPNDNRLRIPYLSRKGYLRLPAKVGRSYPIEPFFFTNKDRKEWTAYSRFDQLKSRYLINFHDFAQKYGVKKGYTIFIFGKVSDRRWLIKFSRPGLILADKGKMKKNHKED